jgi:nitrile hydratase
VNGIHDMGGMDGFGAVEVEPDEPVFHQRWEARVFGMNLLFTGNIDAGRHTIERIAPADYLSLPYYGRWLRSLETRLALRGALAEGELDARIAGRPFPSSPPPAMLPPGNPDARREVERAPAFGVGDPVRARNWQPRGHTRLPAYARGRRGVVAIVHPAFVLPDTNAHGHGENPEHVYSVRFEGAELWGDSAEPGTCVHLDCFESYLEADG